MFLGNGNDKMMMKYHRKTLSYRVQKYYNNDNLQTIISVIALAYISFLHRAMYNIILKRGMHKHWNNLYIHPCIFTMNIHTYIQRNSPHDKSSIMDHICIIYYIYLLETN